MTYEDEVECGYWNKVFSRLSSHNRENPKNPLSISEYKEQLEVIFEGYNATFTILELSIQVTCKLGDNYRFLCDIGTSQNGYAHNFIRFSKIIPNGNILLCYPSFSKVPFWEINEFLYNFELYKEDLQNELAKLPRKEKITNLIMEMIKAYLMNYFENSKTTWNVYYEEGLYIVTVNNGKENSKFKLTPSNWRSEIIRNLKIHI